MSGPPVRGQRRWGWAALLLSALMAGPANADTIILKNGKQIDAKIVKRTDRAVVIDWYGSTLTYWMNEVERIVAPDEAPPAPPPGASGGDDAVVPLSAAVVAELPRFLASRTPLASEQEPANAISLELEVPGATPQLFTLPRSAAIEFANHLFQQQRFEDVVTFCNAFSRADPASGFPPYRIGVALEMLGKPEEAKSSYETSMKREPSIESAFRLWGLRAFQGGREEPAASEWERFDALRKDVPAAAQASRTSHLIDEAFRAGSHYLNNARQFDPAAKEFQMVLRLDPGHESAKLNLLLSRFNTALQSGDETLFNRAVTELGQLAGTARQPNVVQSAKKIVQKSKEIRKRTFGAR